MYARAVDEAAERLHELRHEARGDFGLAALAIALALAAAQFRPALAVPLFLGAVFVAGSGMGAMWRRWDLLDRLAGERDAYGIAEVLALASTAATMERRRACATSIRRTLGERLPELQARGAPVVEQLEALASELDDGELELEPACAVASARLLTDVAESPLLNAAAPGVDLYARIRRIRSGFSPRRVAG